MSKSIYFIPGPSELYFTVEGHLKTALKNHVGSISHRSQDFKDIFQNADSNLRELLGLPSGYHLVFTSSANEVWERILQNCVAESSYHLVCGAFSKKFHKFAIDLGLRADKVEVDLGQGVDPSMIQPNASHELIAFVQNETSTGVCQPLADIYATRENHSEPLIAVDVVSSIPYIDIDYNQLDSVYFSVQKCFGLPAGLGVWIVNDRMVEKAQKMAEEGQKIGTYHQLPAMVKQAQNFQTPETPNVMGIYLLGQVAGDMLTKGIQAIRMETEYKSAVLYQAIESSKSLSPFVQNERFRSKTVIVANTERPSGEIVNEIGKHGMVLGKGYGANKENQIRIANFPTHSKEQIEKLADLLVEL